MRCARSSAAAARWPRPLLNPPHLVGNLDRDKLHRVLGGIDGLEIPATIGVVARAIARPVAFGHCASRHRGRSCAFPLIVRPRGSHAGAGLAKIDDRRRAGTLSSTSGRKQEFFISRFVDYSGDDGLFRKYRIVFVDGRPYACHHRDRRSLGYLVSQRRHVAQRRQTSRRRNFMRAFDADFARRHRTALSGIAERIGLDYFTVDCAETRSGSLLVFEADNTAIVHDMDPRDLFPLQAAADAQDIRRVRDHAGSPRANCTGACRMNVVQREAIAAVRIERDARSAKLGRDSRAGSSHARRHARLRRRYPRASGLVADTRIMSARGFAPHCRSQPTDLDEVYREFTDFIVPYATGNVHPGFMGWVHGGGTAVGMLAEMLAAGLNANLGGRDHMPIEVERQIVEWMRAMFGFPDAGERHFRHRHVDGQSDGGAGGANSGARTIGSAARHRRCRVRC